MPATLEDVHEFLAQSRIALVGLSRNPKDFSRVVFREMCRRGYDMIGVNPFAAGELDGRGCFARVQDIDPPPAGLASRVPLRIVAAHARPIRGQGRSG